MNAEELKTRSKKFSLRIFKLVAALPNSIQGRAIGSQLIRCGTSVAANYRAACRSRSKAEFVAKIGLAEEEADESAFWMELIIESGMLREKGRRSLAARGQGISCHYGAFKNFRCKIAEAKAIVDQLAIGNRQSAIL